MLPQGLDLSSPLPDYFVPFLEMLQSEKNIQ
jgi:hypothetical protein